MDRTRLGLDFSEIERARASFGENRFTVKKQAGFVREFFRGFRDPMIVILLVALAVDLVFAFRGGTSWWEPSGIACAVFTAVFVSTLSEYRSSRAFEKLRAEADKVRCRVRRGGRVCEIGSGEIVVGDVVLLGAGDRIASDGKMIFGAVSIDQSALNGETQEAHKFPSPYQRALNNSDAVFSGTLVLSGDGEMEVTAVGDATLYGALARELQEPVRKSPLTEKLSKLAKAISCVGYAAALLIAAVDLVSAAQETQMGVIGGLLYLFSHPALLARPLLHAVTLGVTVVVVAVPEGLPMMITVVLSRQMRRMLDAGVLVRRLSGIETAGAIDLLFCDKTGTLTCGTHTLTALLDRNGAPVDPGTLTGSARLALARQLYLNNQAYLAEGAVCGSNATDRALLRAFCDYRLETPDDKILKRLPFESAAKYAAVELSAQTLIKGAPERVLGLCSAKIPDRRAILKRLKSYAEQGMRTLAFAASREPLADAISHNSFEPEFFAVLSDPLRAETPETIRTLQTAGVQVALLTGDGRDTALYAARKAGILQTPKELVLSGDELRRLSDRKIAERLSDLRVVYRCEPGDKSRLARVASETGRVCGMTGDGVNDAPALKLSDIGFSMGSGTVLAKDASDIVLTRDRLSAIPTAILYGRTVFSSIRKFLIFQLSMNFCALSVSFLGPLMGFEEPISIMQMLWVNLIMDTLASLAFAGEPARADDLTKPPIKRSAPILDAVCAVRIAFGTLFSVGASAFFLTNGTIRAFYGSGDDAFLCAFFLLFIFLGVFNAFNVRASGLRLFHDLSRNRAFLLIIALIALIQILLTYFGGELFGCTPLPVSRLLFPILCALLILPADLLRKSLFRRASRT